MANLARHIAHGIALLLLLFTTTWPAQALPPGPLVSPAWLRDHAADAGLVIVDLRSGQEFRAGHVPRAVSGEYPDIWRNPDWTLLPVATLEANLSKLGIDGSKTVILVPAGSDGTELGGATFAYWVLKYLGHSSVAILDGGWLGWTADVKAPTATGDGKPVPAKFVARLQPAIRASTDDVSRAIGGNTVLIDARSPDQYAGQSKSGLVSRAGHIPGALNLPFANAFSEARHGYKLAAELAKLVPAPVSAKDAPIITYCNTGHWGSIDWFMLSEVLGYTNVRLYDGSMAAWTADPNRKVALGDKP